MRKYFLCIVIFFLLLIQFLGRAPLTFAAGETYTWSGSNIIVTGGQLQNSATLTPSFGGGYIGNFNIKKPPGSCVLQIYIALPANGASGTITSGPGTLNPAVKNECPTTIIDQYQGEKITISGTAKDSSKQVIITYTASNAPNPLTFTVKGKNCGSGCNPQSVKGKSVTESGSNIDTFCNTVYIATFYLDPGTYQVCAPTLTCQTFTKQAGVPIQKLYGHDVTGLSVDLLVGLSAGSGPFTITIKGPNNFNKSTKTSVPAGVTSTGNCQADQQAAFCGVPAGTYTLCVQGLAIACQNVTQVDGKQGTVNFNALGLDPNVGLGTNACQAGPTPLPPPPSPPCGQWQGGQCTSFSSALGAFTTDPSGFIQKIFAILLSVSGGIALLLIIRAGYQVITSQGKPEQIQQGRDQLIAAIVGLVFLIFSFVFLQLIGFDILHIPGFGAGGSTAPAVCKPNQCVPTNQCKGILNGFGKTCTTNGCPAGEACSS